MTRSAQRLIRLSWRDAEPTVIKLLADSFVIGIATLCIAAVLFEVWCLLNLGDLLFGSMEYYVKAASVIGELLLSIYVMHFTHQK
jgi:hypothetical protein